MDLATESGDRRMPRPERGGTDFENKTPFQVSKSCNRQQLPSSVTRGVRSRPLDEGAATPTKVETVPLLSPTMESVLLNEPWVFPRIKVDSVKEEDTFCAWEEDFQDLSSWCMDTFQGHFHIGESTTFKLSGTKYEGNGISTVVEEKILRDLKSTVDDETWSVRIKNVKTIEEPGDNRHLLPSASKMANEHAKGYNNYEENNATSLWLMSPESTASTSTSSSKQHNNNNNNADIGNPSIRSEYRANEKDDLVCPTPSLDAIANQREMWDELRTIETTGSDTFDLLSYLWDDEMRTPNGSVPADSTAMLKVKQHAATAPSSSSSSSSSALPPASTRVKTETDEPTTDEPPARRRMETRATSTVTSSTVEPAVMSPRRSERTRTMSSGNKERETITIAKNTRKNKSERKRYYESESEEDVALVQYRECREKNNEASRRSRMNKKAKESEMSTRAIELERDNRILKMKVEELEKLVTSMRSALLRSAMKKES